VFYVVRPSVCESYLLHGTLFRDMHRWMFTKLLSVVHLETKMNRLGFVVKSSKVKVKRLEA